MANRRKLKKAFSFSQPAASSPSSLTFFVAQAKLTITYIGF